MLHSFIIAFSMYSKIPMPKIAWKKESMQYTFCFFPLIGAVIGLFTGLWNYLALHFEIGTILYAAIMTVIPVAITGGIHFDGFLDTIDALSSFQSKEQKLEILKDPHAGAFAILGGICYILLFFALWTEVPVKAIPVIMVSFILSRTLSGLSVVTFRNAKKAGLAAEFSDAAHKKNVILVIAFYGISCIIIMLCLHVIYGFAALMAAAITFIYYHHVSYKQFGGITGDLAGFFLQLCEIMILLFIVIISKIFV